jgi:metalloprotein, YbeY family
LYVYIEKKENIIMHMHYKKLIAEMVEAVLRYENCPFECEVSVIITDDNGIRKYNNEYRGLDKSTDVLSFPLINYSSPADFKDFDKKSLLFNPENKALMLGDIIISAEHVISQALEYNHSQKRELAFLVTHSMLHLLGYDHINEAEREIMEKKQKIILEEQGYIR